MTAAAAAAPRIGHNGGPLIESGTGFRKLAWAKARQDLMPVLPLEVVRIRVARAKRLGLDYRTYATIRASTGRDIVGFLFSGNALDLRPRQLEVPDAIKTRLAALDGVASRMVAVYAPAYPCAVVDANAGLIDLAMSAPAITENWSAMRDRIRAGLRDAKLPPDGVVLITATTIEREWCGAGQLAGMLSADRFFRSVHV